MINKTIMEEFNEKVGNHWQRGNRQNKLRGFNGEISH
jgi:hypothetical protein